MDRTYKPQSRAATLKGCGCGGSHDKTNSACQRALLEAAVTTFKRSPSEASQETLRAAASRYLEACS